MTGLICHINLARGYRGGERQTELLIRALHAQGLKQRLIARAGDVLIQRLADLPELERIGLRQPFLPKLFVCKGAAVLQVHEAKAGHMACIAHSLFGMPYVLTRRVDKPPHASRLNRRLYRNAEAVVSVSAAIAQILQAGLVEREISVIPDAHTDFAVDDAQVSALRSRYKGKFLIGHAGALVDRHKGQKTLIEALRLLQDRCPDLQLLLLGQGEDEALMREAAAGLTNVHFEGFVDNLGDYLAVLDLFVYPSRFEGLGSVLLDAMNAGLPIVATDVGGIPEIVVHDDNGLLVEPGNAAALADMIERLYRDSALRDRLAAAARRCAEAYSPAVMARRYAAIYNAATA